MKLKKLLRLFKKAYRQQPECWLSHIVIFPDESGHIEDRDNDSIYAFDTLDQLYTHLLTRIAEKETAVSRDTD